MKLKRSAFFVTLGLVLAGLGLVLLPRQSESMQQPASKEHQLVIKKVRNKWVVEAPELGTVPPGQVRRLKAKRGHKIVWTAQGTDAYFQFLDDKLFGNYTRTVKKGKKLILTVGNGARSGVHYYAVFCMADSVFAEGGSPPSIEIDN